MWWKERQTILIFFKVICFRALWSDWNIATEQEECLSLVSGLSLQLHLTNSNGSNSYQVKLSLVEALAKFGFVISSVGILVKYRMNSLIEATLTQITWRIKYIVFFLCEKLQVPGELTRIQISADVVIRLGNTWKHISLYKKSRILHWFSGIKIL